MVEAGSVSPERRHLRSKALVVVPTYNEATVISEVLTQLLSCFPYVVVVDDGSTDESRDRAMASSATVLAHPINLGQGAAIMTGIEWGLRQTECEFIATFDADGQHRVADLVSAVERIAEGDVDVVLGSRFLADKVQAPLGKRVLLRMGVAQTRLLTRLRLTDTHNGLRVFSRRMAEQLRLSNGMSHASDFLADLSRSRLSYAEIPIEVNYTEYSRHKGQPMINAVNILFDSMARSR